MVNYEDTSHAHKTHTFLGCDRDCVHVAWERLYHHLHKVELPLWREKKGGGGRKRRKKEGGRGREEEGGRGGRSMLKTDMTTRSPTSDQS